MQGDANVILRNAINVNQWLQMTDYADAFLYVGSLACMPMHVACCSMSQCSIKEAGVLVLMVLSSGLFRVLIARVRWLLIKPTVECVPT